MIATNYGPIPEMVDDEVGSLFELGDEVDLAGKIIAELSQWDRLMEKGRKGRERVVDRFSFRNSCLEFEGLYEDLVNGSTIYHDYCICWAGKDAQSTPCTRLSENLSLLVDVDIEYRAP